MKKYGLFCALLLLFFCFSLPSSSACGWEGTCTVTGEEMRALSFHLNSAKKSFEKQKQESEQLKKQLAQSEKTLQQAETFSAMLTAQLKASETTLKREKEALQNVRTSFEAYRKEEEKRLRHLKRERNISWLIVAGLVGYMAAGKV